MVATKHCQPCLTMVDHGSHKALTTMVEQAFLNHGQQWSTTKVCEMAPQSTMVGKSFVNHGQPWLVKVLSTMVDHG